MTFLSKSQEIVYLQPTSNLYFNQSNWKVCKQNLFGIYIKNFFESRNPICGHNRKSTTKSMKFDFVNFPDFGHYCLFAYILIQRNSLIYQFDLDQILNTISNVLMNFARVSKGSYWILYEKSFNILNDNKTIFGAKSLNSNQLVIEDITNNEEPKIIHNFTSSISTILSAQQQYLLVGDYSGNVVQFKNNQGVWQFFYNYQNVGIGWITSGSVQGDLAVLGGHKRSIRIFDLNQAMIYEEPLQTAIQFIYSLIFYFIEGKILLAVFGEKSSYLNLKSDLFDFTNYYKNGMNKVYGEDFKRSFQAVLEINSKELIQMNKHNQELKLLVEEITTQQNRLLTQKDERIRQLEEKPLEVRQKEFEFENELNNIQDINIEYPNENNQMSNILDQIDIEAPKVEDNPFSDLQKQMKQFTVEKEQLTKEKKQLKETVGKKDNEIENLQNLLKKMTLSRVDDIKKEREQEIEQDSVIKNLTIQLEKREDFLENDEDEIKSSKASSMFGKTFNGYCGYCRRGSESDMRTSLALPGSLSKMNKFDKQRKFSANYSKKNHMRGRCCKQW
jgi:hypothetical protein